MNAVNPEAIERAAADETASPSLSTEDMAADRMRTLVNDLSKGGRQQLTEARDQIDDLMRALDRRGELLLQGVAEYAAFVQQAVAMKGILMEPVGNLAEAIGKGMTPTPVRTLTQVREGA